MDLGRPGLELRMGLLKQAAQVGCYERSIQRVDTCVQPYYFFSMAAGPQPPKNQNRVALGQHHSEPPPPVAVQPTAHPGPWGVLRDPQLQDPSWKEGFPESQEPAGQRASISLKWKAACCPSPVKQRRQRGGRRRVPQLQNHC